MALAPIHISPSTDGKAPCLLPRIHPTPPWSALSCCQPWVSLGESPRTGAHDRSTPSILPPSSFLPDSLRGTSRLDLTQVLPEGSDRCLSEVSWWAQIVKRCHGNHSVTLCCVIYFLAELHWGAGGRAADAKPGVTVPTGASAPTGLYGPREHPASPWIWLSSTPRSRPLFLKAWPDNHLHL